jgi:hypothetical protein
MIPQDKLNERYAQRKREALGDQLPSYEAVLRYVLHGARLNALQHGCDPYEEIQQICDSILMDASERLEAQSND